MSSITKAVSRYNTVKYINILTKNGSNIRRRQTLLFHTCPILSVKGQEIKMPSLSPTMSEGKIVKWLKKEGDTISPGDVLCDIETDKAIVSMETEEEGILAKILVQENSQMVSVGSLIALMVMEGENWKEVEMPSGGAPEASKPAALQAQPSGEPPAAAAPTLSGPAPILVNMPSLSPTMTAGTVLKWYKKEGDTVAAGDVLCDIQTDKAVISFETDEDGILAKILIPADTKDVQVGTLIALIVGEGEDWKNVAVPQVGAPASQGAPASAPSPVTAAPAAPMPHTGAAADSFDPFSKDGKPCGPAVRSLLSAYQLDPKFIKATGRNDMLLKEDVLRYIEENKVQKKAPTPVSLPSATSGAPQKAAARAPVTPAQAPSPLPPPPPRKDLSSPYKESFGRRSRGHIDIELSNIRRVIAKRLTESKQDIPHSYGMVRAQMDDLVEMRKQMNAQGITASLNDYIIKASAYALAACPKVNTINVNNEYQHSPTIDIAVAVATSTGLITPIVTDVSGKRIDEISRDIKELAGRARAGKLKPHEFQGGSFTISNLGMFGIKHFTAIINPPQIAILAVGSLVDRYGSDQRTHFDALFTLSYDRRALDEDEAAEFLEKLKYYVENPRILVAENLSTKRALSL